MPRCLVGNPLCPVSLYKCYRDKRAHIPDEDSPFYLTPNSAKDDYTQPDDGRLWFKSSPMGVNAINSLVKVRM